MRKNDLLAFRFWGYLVFGVVTLGAVACDEEKKAPAPVALKPVAATPASVETKAAPTPAPAKKKDVVCNVGASIEFTDKVLESDVRKKLSKADGPIAPSDLKAVRSLNLTGGPVNELDPCLIPLFVGMKDLFLGPGDLEDLTPIANLTNLESLRASISKVSDLKPLAKLVKLDRLDLARTAIRDIEPLRALVNLTELALDDTQILDVAALAPLTKLEKVSLKNTPVKDVGPLKGLKKLKVLNLSGTPTEDVSALTPLVEHGLRILRK
jgi:internalin A